MPFGGLLSIAGPLMSGIGAIGGLMGGSPAQNVQLPQQYNFQNTPGADTNAYQGIGSLGNYNVAANLLPQYQQIAQQSISSPYAQQYQQGANLTGAAGMGSGAAQTGTALSALPDVQALLSLGFDPQQALYSKLQNQNQQQNAAILGQSGVASTPYGAGVAADANSNFNLNWQNQALQRAIQGAQGAGGLLGSIGQSTGTGLNQMATGAGLPYNTMQGITANQLNTLGQTGAFGQSAATLPQQQIQDYLQYLQQATGQQGVNQQGAQVGLNQANMAFGQNQALGSQLGGALAGLSKGWGNVGGGFGGGSGGFATNAWGQANPGVAGSAFQGPIAA